MTYNFNLESKIAALVVALIIGVYGVQTYIDYTNEVALAESRYQSQASTIAETLKYSIVEAVREQDVELLEAIARDIIAANPDINQISITSSDGDKLAQAVKNRNNPEVNSVSTTVRDNDLALATINVSFLTAPLRNYLQHSLQDKGLTALMVIGVAILLTSLLSRRVTRPLTVLTAAVSRVAAGDLRQKVTVNSRDEIGVLGQTFNQMTESLDNSHNELNRANSSLEKKIRELTTLFEIDQLINRSTEVREVLHLTMEMMTTGFGVEMGAIMLRRESDGLYYIVESCGLGENTRSGHRLDPDAGAIGPLIMLGEPLLLEDPATCPELLAGFAPDEKQRSSCQFIIPLKTGQQTLGLLNIYRLASGEKPDEELRHLFTIIASLVAPLIQLNILSAEKMNTVTDPFTPLAERIDRELARAGKFNLPLSVALVRIENFSAYCAANSYPAGMSLLDKLQETFLPEVPSAESIIRFGLNSFVVIQAGKDDRETRERMEAAIVRARASLPALAALTVTVRVSTSPGQGKEAFALLDRLTGD